MMEVRGEFGDVVTVYNRSPAADNDCWQRTVLQGVAVTDNNGEAMRHGGAASSSARRIGAISVGDMVVIVPWGVRDGYLTPMAWRLCDNRQGYWTLQPGDIMVKGKCELELSEDSAELMDGCERMATINVVTELGGRSALAHWEVSAR